MKKQEIIKKSLDYTKIINKNNKLKNKYYSIFYEENPTNTKFGISIPTNTGKAVVRNKLKRQIKNIIDKNKNIIKKHYNYVIIVKKEILELNYINKEQELINLITRIGEQNEKK